MRILQHLVQGTFTPLNKRLDFTDGLADQFLNSTHTNDSVRIHIPRALRMIYDVRNRRGVGHVSSDINPNLMDSIFVVSVADWVLAELIRLYANQSPEEAQETIDSIVEKKAPILWDLDGKAVILDSGMQKQNVILVFLYRKGKEGANIKELNGLLVTKIARIRGFLTQLVTKRFIAKSPRTNCYVISPLGVDFVEKNVPLSVTI